MEIINKVHELKNILTYKYTNKKIGFVATMGYLHEGHLSLIRQAKIENDIVIVSIFVNPTQFSPGEDFEKYPRDIKRDSQLAKTSGANILFCPDTTEMYPVGSSTYVEIEGIITKKLCGKSRPSHFKGVTTILTMLFNIIKPDNAYFGQKDAQQCAVIKKMVRDLFIDVNIQVCPIYREIDGLAMSSRNIFLNEEERCQATVLNLSLKEIERLYLSGEKDVIILKSELNRLLSSAPLANIDYIEIVDNETLEDISIVNSPTLVAIAVNFRNTRLLDNIILK
ncbi:MAG: pantoate--beta-alanine ligase [Eubacteriaceae bacterium]